jgi:hypothetical protein
MSHNNYTSLILVVIISIWSVYNDKDKITKMKSLFENTKWFGHFVILILFTLWNLFFSPKGSKEIIATKKAFIAFVIALFASLDLTIAPFWIIWVISYYFESWL